MVNIGNAPNNIVTSPGHRISVSTVGCTRVTSSNVSQSDAGLHITGHHQDMAETSELRFNGSSHFKPSFGPGMPEPAFRVLTGTKTEAQVDAGVETTDANGEVEINWGNRFAFEDRPILAVQLEDVGSWYIQEYLTDAEGHNTGVIIQVTNQGSAAGSGIGVRALLEGT